MGLDIRRMRKVEEDQEHIGSYSGFNAFREELAKIVQINLNKYAGFGGIEKMDEQTSFYELLNHSDCDGELSYEECTYLLEDFNNHWKHIIATKDTSFIEQCEKWKELLEQVDEDCYLEFT